VSDETHKKAISDRVKDDGRDEVITRPVLAQESQTDAKGQKALEAARTNRSDGSAGKSDAGDMDSVRIEAIDKYGNRRSVSRKDGGTEKDLERPVDTACSAAGPMGGYQEIQEPDGGILLKGVIPGTDAELENITTDTMKAISSENALVKNALEMRRQIDEYMEPGPEKDRVVRQLKADITSTLMTGAVPESELGGTHNAISESSVRALSGNFTDLPMDQQLNTLGALFLDSAGRYAAEQRERALGATIGTVESLGEMTMDLVTIAEFAGDVIIGNKDRAAEKGEKFGEALGKTLVGGVNVFKDAHAYLYNVGFEGDYYKPFRDMYVLGKSLDQEWSNLSPLDQERLKYKLATDIVAGALPIGTAARVTEANKLTTVLEEAALLGNEMNQGEATSSSVGSLFKEFLGPRKSAESIENALIAEQPTGLELLVENVEKRLAGAGGAWDTIDEHPSPDVVHQLHKKSCVSACGEMLTKGQVPQQLLIDELRLYWPESMRVEEMPAAIEWLGMELRACHGPRWKAGTERIAYRPPE